MEAEPFVVTFIVSANNPVRYPLLSPMLRIATYHGGILPSTRSEKDIRRIPKEVNAVGYGVTANIAASHAAARGSTPRIRVFLFSVPKSTRTRRHRY